MQSFFGITKLSAFLSRSGWQDQNTSKAASPLTPARLPTELYRLILSLLPPGTQIYPLLFVDSAFHAETQRLLYTNISLSGPKAGVRSKSNLSPIHTRLFDLLARTARLSNLVHSFVLPAFISQGVSRWEPYGTQEKYWEHLNLALQRMSNLKEFTIGSFYSRERVQSQVVWQIPTVFASCSFRLRKVAILNMDHQALNILIEEIGSDLEEFSCHWNVGSLYRKISEAFPKLEILEVTTASRRVPTLMASPRKVKALSWNVYMGHMWVQDSQYPHLCALKITTMNLIGFDKLVTAFPSLRFLAIYSPASSRTEMFNSAVIHLHSLPFLRKFALGSETPIDWVSPKDFQEGVGRLFRDSQQLQCVRLGDDEWTRHGSGSVNEKQDEWKDRAWWN